MRIYKILALVLLISATSCEELTYLSQQAVQENAPLTNSDIVSGLKEALIVGAGNSVNILGVTDGYYKDQLVKVLLPPEANIIIENISKIPGGDKLVDDLVLSINRSAEDAAKEAKPIFVNSIKSMSITDAMGILNGADDAATQYLISTTNQQLFDLYKPKINSSLDKKLIGNISTNDSWNQLTSKWNAFANSIVGQLAGYKPVNTKLDDYLTQKALDGMFLKIADEEKLIRDDPMARVNDILKRVFGSQDI